MSKAKSYSVVENCPCCGAECDIDSKDSTMVVGSCPECGHAVIPCNSCVSFMPATNVSNCWECEKGSCWEFCPKYDHQSMWE